MVYPDLDVFTPKPLWTRNCPSKLEMKEAAVSSLWSNGVGARAVATRTIMASIESWGHQFGLGVTKALETGYLLEI
jgi:hypothetical protein